MLSSQKTGWFNVVFCIQKNQVTCIYNLKILKSLGVQIVYVNNKNELM